MEEQAAVTIPRLTLRDEDIGRAGDVVVDYREERRTVIEMQLKPRTVEQLMTTTELQPCTKVDPATGHACTVYEMVPTTKTVTATVYDYVPVSREVVVRIPYLKPAGELIVRHLVLDAPTVAAVATRLRVEVVPNEAALVPPPPPLPPPCPTGACPAVAPPAGPGPQLPPPEREGPRPEAGPERPERLPPPEPAFPRPAPGPEPR
jgi:hypothetical protein